jgi:hypothetical protein
MWPSLFALLPLAAALHFPHLGSPSPNDAISAAEALLHSGPGGAGYASPETVLSYANDMTLSMIEGDEHMVITSQSHPVSRIGGVTQSRSHRPNGRMSQTAGEHHLSIIKTESA